MEFSVVRPRAALTVSQLNTYVKALLEGDKCLAGVTVEGEISDFKRHYATGHLYFSLKDESARVRCVMFRSDASRLSFSPENGVRVTVTGRATVYEAGGDYQLSVRSMRVAGEGALALMIEQLKKKLAAEGLFDPSRKRDLPRFPKRIGVVTSASGAAFHDITNVLSRRFPLCEIVLCPAAVQGPSCPAENVAALRRLNALPDIDLIIIGRGGGSAEDLMGYNNEALVREVAASRVPVISAVGHEIDWSLCDLAADLRAPTPSAAAEICSPDIDDLKLWVDNMSVTAYNLALTAVTRRLDLQNAVAARLRACSPSAVLDNRKNEVRLLLMRAANSASGRVNALIASETARRERLKSFDPERIFQRGYTAVRAEGRRVTSVAGLEKGQELTLEFYDGAADVAVKEIHHGQKRNNV